MKMILGATALFVVLWAAFVYGACSGMIEDTSP